MKKYILFSAIILFLIDAKAQQESFSIDMLNSEIKRTLEENERQKEMSNKQNVNTTLETTNQQQWKKYKDTAKKIQERFKIVDFSLQAIPSGYVISQKTREIKRIQNRILREISTTPQSIRKVLPRQIKFVDDLQMTTRFLVGIVASYGAMNQMERAERQILLDYALEEVNKLERESLQTLMIIQLAKESTNRRKGILEYYINRDKEIVQDIFRNIKNL